MFNTFATSASPLEDADVHIICPKCGYDLRAATNNRCSECGAEVDLKLLARSNLAWPQLIRISKLRGFLRTVFQITFDTKSIREEWAKPQELKDAKVFGRWVRCIVIASLYIGLAWIIYINGRAFFVATRDDTFSFFLGSGSHISENITVPWSAGATLWPVLAITPLLFGWFLTLAQRPMFQPSSDSEQLIDRAKALGGYALAPLVWLLPAVVWTVLVIALTGQLGLAGPIGPPRPNDYFTPMMIPAGLMFAVAVIGTLVRVGQWRARTKDRKVLTAIYSGCELLVRWGFTAVVILGIFPWFVGFVWILIDSFR